MLSSSCLHDSNLSNICVCFYLPCLLQMHTPTKKTKTEVTGFIHNVSPVKMSQKQKPYFTATIQEETTYRDIVVFNKQQHSAFNDIATSKYVNLFSIH